MRVDLRPANEGDLDFLLNLRVLTMEKYLQEDGVPCTEKDHLHRIKYNFSDAKIIEIEQERIGLLKASYLPEQRQWYLFQIQLHPRFQGSGIGRSLICGLIDKARSRNETIGLSVLKSNPAIKLYKSLGFIVASEDCHEFEMVLKP